MQPKSSSKKTSSKKKSNSSTSKITMYNKQPLKDHTIIAPRFMTKVSTAWQGYLAIGVSTSQAISIYGNSFFQPFNTPSQPITSQFTPSGGSAVNQVFPGYTSLSSLYRYYRVNGSRIKVTLQPSTSADIFELMVFPVTSIQATATVNQASSNQYSKNKLCSFTNNVAQNTITSYMPSNKVLGLTYQQFQDQLPIIVSAAPAASLDWYWQVQFSALNGSNNTLIIPIYVELDYYLELSDPVFQTA